MSKKKRAKRQTSRLNQHKRQGKKLIPPLMAVDPELFSWNRDMLPEMLLIDGILTFDLDDFGQSARLFHRIIDILDAYNGDSSKIVTGTISSMSLISERSKVLKVLRNEGIYDYLVPDELKHGLALYPQNPSAWLIEDWLNDNHADWELGIQYLKQAVTRLYAVKGHIATMCQMLVLSRSIKHGKIKFTTNVIDQDKINLFTKYPYGLTDDEKQYVESSSRAMFNAITSLDDLRNSPWTEFFWSTNFRISACIFSENKSSHSIVSKEELDGINQQLQIELRKLISKIQISIEQCQIDIYRIDKSEVLFGLTSRQIRIYQQLVLVVENWLVGSNMMLLRTMADILINLKWMTLQNDNDVFTSFKKFSIGNTKLYKLKIEDMIDNGMTYLEPLAEDLQSMIDEESLEEFINIDLGSNYDGTNIREKAIQSELKDVYDLVYSPASSELHSEWMSLKQNDLVRCLNPLHRFHRLPNLSRPNIVSFSNILLASRLLSDTVKICMESLDSQYSNLNNDLTNFQEAVESIFKG